MKEIKLDRYLPELSTLYSFYTYSELALSKAGVQRELEESEFRSLYSTAIPFLTDSPVPQADLPRRFEEMVRRKVADEIQNGLATLR